MSRVNKAAIVANANTARKRCCCKQLPCLRPGLRVEVIKGWEGRDKPNTEDKLAAFDFARDDGEIIDGGVITSAIDFGTLQDEWETAIPILKDRPDSFAVRFTGYIRFDGSGEKTIKVTVDDHLVMSLNGKNLAFLPEMKRNGQLGTHVASATVTKGLVRVNITYAQYTSGKALKLYEVVDGKDEIIDSARFFRLA